MKCPNCNSVQDDQPGGWRYSDNNQPHVNTTTFRNLFGGQNANYQEIPNLNTLPSKLLFYNFYIIIIIIIIIIIMLLLL